MTNLPPMPQRLRDIFNAAFMFRRKYQFPQNTVVFWETVSDEMTAIAAQFHGDPMIVDLLAACYCDIEREMLNRKEDGG